VKLTPKTQRLLLPLLVLMIALAFRLIRVDQESYFIDEVLTRQAAEGSVWRHCLDVEFNPPLYFLLAKIWTRLFGMSLDGIRVFSALAGALAAAFLVMAGREMGMSAPARWLCGLLVATNPMLVWYGQQARCYALVTMALSLWLWLVPKTIHGGEKRWTALLCLVLLAGFSTHYFFAFPVAGGLVVLLWGYSRTRPFPALRSGLLAHLCCMGVWLLYLPMICCQVHRGPVGRPPLPRWTDLSATFVDVFLAGPFHQNLGWARRAVVAYYGVLILVILLGALARLVSGAASEPVRPTVSWGAFLIVSALFPVIVPFVVSFGGISIFLKDRYTVLALPSLCLGMAYVFDRVRPRALRWAGLSLTALTLLPLAIVHDVDFWKRCQDFDWRGAARLIEEEWREGDVIVFLPEWMYATYVTNGGKMEPVVGEDYARILEAIRPKRTWEFVWLSDGDEKRRAFSEVLHARPGAVVRVDFAHIKLWLIPETVSASGSRSP